ncbi:RagB/SusD family nutrient uptake outer membrane protein, partial [Pedobacter sp.]
MKKSIHIFSMLMLVIILTSTSSCKKFLETTPKSFLSADNYYNTEAELFDALAGVYDILGSQSLYRYRNLVWFNNEGDEGYYRNSSTTSTFTFNYSVNDPQISDYWQDIYIGINRANYLLASVDKNTNISQQYRDMIRGEALFLRGFYYFSLVQNFGDVPLILTPTMSADNLEVPRTPSKQVYEQIIKDMEQAEGLVQTITQLKSSGRVNKSAVRGILARVCLHMAGYPLRDQTKYAEARKWAKMVMDDAEAGHALNSSYDQVFINYVADDYDLKESIWEVEFWGNTSDNFRESGHV